MDPLAPAFVGAAIVSIGWLATHFLSSRRGDRARRIERQVAYHDQQIAELYGPLLYQIIELYALKDLEYDLLQEAGSCPPNTSKVAAVKRGFDGSHWRRIHHEIRDILKTKIFLSHEKTLLPSVYCYLRHSFWESDIKHLCDEFNPEPFGLLPPEFFEDVRKGLEKAIEKRREALNATDGAAW